MTDLLSKICADKRRHIKKCKEKNPENRLLTEARRVSPARRFANRLNQKTNAKEFALIAEIKKASPSEGVIREDFNPEELAVACEKGGATCLSVLTDTPYFQGRDEYLTRVRKASTLPVLRKDFILEPYQVIEARVIGADCILLIMAAVDDSQAHEIESIALSLGMDILIEVHNEAELERALKLQSNLIGINNRNLKTLETDLSITEGLMKNIPEDYLVVCESGISSHDDLKRMEQSGVYCFLVGESLMRESDVEGATRKLLAPAPRPDWEDSDQGASRR